METDSTQSAHKMEVYLLTAGKRCDQQCPMSTRRRRTISTQLAVVSSPSLGVHRDGRMYAIGDFLYVPLCDRPDKSADIILRRRSTHRIDNDRAIKRMRSTRELGEDHCAMPLLPAQKSANRYDMKSCTRTGKRYTHRRPVKDEF